MSDQDKLIIAGKAYESRLLVGTGKYASLAETAAVIAASGAQIVTVAVRRVNITESGKESLQDYLSPEEYTYLPNTAGCYTAEEAVRTLRLAREVGGWNLVKLEVIGDKTSLYPDAEETLKAAKILVSDGFQVMAYTNDDPIAAKKLEDAGVAAVMPLGAPIGSGLGLQNIFNIQMIIENAKVPVLVDAGVGKPSHVAVTMELGCDGVLLNTAIAEAGNPRLMAEAMKLAVEAGRKAYLAKPMRPRLGAFASSPLTGMVGG